MNTVFILWFHNADAREQEMRAVTSTIERAQAIAQEQHQEEGLSWTPRTWTEDGQQMRGYVANLSLPGYQGCRFSVREEIVQS